MFLTNRLPTKIFVIIILVIGVIGLVSWRGILIFEDIRQISNEIIKLSRGIHKAEKEFTGWETYRNKEYGFEVKHPSNFVAEQVNNAVDFHPSEPNPSIIHPSISVFDGTLEERIQAIKIEFKISTSPFSKIISDREISLNNYTGRELILRSEMGHEIQYVFLVRNSKIYQFEVDNFDVGRLRNIFPQILSTFKFIEPIDTSDWNTYRNEKYGFEIKYPQDWEIFEILDKQKYGREGITLNSPARQKFEEVDTPSDIRIAIETKSAQLSLEEFINTHSDGWYSRYAVEEITTIGEKNARYVKSSVYRPANVIFIDNGYYVLIIPFNLDETYPDMPNLTTYKSIINTIWFTN